MIMSITGAKMLISSDTDVLQLDVTGISRKDLEAFVADFRPGKYNLKKVGNKRSLNANAYMWVLCDRIAAKLRTTKEDIYRRAIADVGVFADFTLTEPDAMDAFRKNWRRNGIGWLTATIDNTHIRAYFGSSRYEQDEMSRLINWLTEAAQDLQIPTLSDDELKLMIGRWTNGGEKENGDADTI